MNTESDYLTALKLLECGPVSEAEMAQLLDAPVGEARRAMELPGDARACLALSVMAVRETGANSITMDDIVGMRAKVLVHFGFPDDFQY